MHYVVASSSCQLLVENEFAMIPPLWLCDRNDDSDVLVDVVGSMDGHRNVVIIFLLERIDIHVLWV